jgi:heptosyltransferase-1
MTRIAIFRTDKIGDLIVSTPVLAAIKAKHPEAKIMMVASPYNAVVLQGVENIDELVLYDKKLPKPEKQAIMKKIRSFSPTHTLVLSPKNDCFFLAFQSGAKKRGGLLSSYRWLPRALAPVLLTHQTLIPRYGKRPHQTDISLGLARRMGLAAEGEFPYRMVVSEKAKAAALAHLEKQGVTPPYFIAHLSDKWLEAWTPEDLLYFLEQVSHRFGVKIVTTAGPVDQKLGTALAGKIPMLTNLPFAEWCAVLDQAKCVLAPDNAPVHVACALKKPLLAVYPRNHLEEALSEFGPRGTNYRARVLNGPEVDIPLYLNDIESLLK